MSLTFKVERVSDVWPDLIELFRMHWMETERYRHGQPFNPLLERYAYYESVEFYRLYTARDGARLVGNCGMYVTESMHTQLKIATEDTLFLHPDCRGGLNAKRFIEYVKNDLIALGCREISITAKSERVGRLLEHLAFEQSSVQYSLQVAPTARVATQPVGEPSNDATAGNTSAHAH